MTSRLPLLIAAAVPAELAIINYRMSGKKIIHHGPIELHTGSINERGVATAVTGPGTVNMAGVLGALFAAQSSGTVIVTGCGGGFEGSGLSLGDIAIATEEVHGQLGVEDETGPGPVHGLPLLENRYVLNQTLMQKAFNALQKEGHGMNVRISKGPFLTVASVTSRAETAVRYRNRYDVIVENMEGFAAAALCKQYDIPLLELRAVSNMVGQTDRDTWQLDLAFARAQEAVLHVLEQGVI